MLRIDLRKLLRIQVVITALVMLGVMMIGVSAEAQQQFNAAAYFKDKTIRLIVPSSAGGGADVRTRIFADIAGKRYFPGPPKLTVVNVPGAGGSIGVRRGMESKPDGLTSFRVSQRFLLKEVVGETFDYFDSTKAIILGADNNSQPQMWYVRRSLAKTWDEVLALGRPVTEGATGPEPTGQEMLALLGYPIRMVYGYGGAAQVRAAFARGEIEASDLLGPHMLKLYPDLVKQSAYVPILWWGADPRKDQQSIDYLKELGADAPPFIFDVVKVTDEQRTVFDVSTAFPTATTFFPPGVRAEIVDVWKNVMAQTYRDAEMQERSLAAGTSVVWMPAEDIQALLDRGRKVVESPDHRKLLMNLMGDR